MKRLFITLFVLLTGALFIQSPALAEDSQNHEKGWTNPILVEKDTDAVYTGFFTHPPTGKFSTEYDVGAREIFASPGKKTSNVSPDMFFNLQPRGNLSPLHGIGPEDIQLTTSDGVLVKGMLDYQSSGNNSGRQLTVGAIRKETSAGEFETLFGSDPLEDGLIGDIAETAPYDNGLYPAAIMNPDKKFQYCMPSGGIPFYRDCGSNMKAIDNAFDDIFIYSPKTVDDLIVGASYDPFLLNVKSESGIDKNGTSSFEQNSAELPATYISPLVFFKRGDSLKLLGYTSFQMPAISNSVFPSSAFDIGSNYSLVLSAVKYELLESVKVGKNNEVVTENASAMLGYDLTNPYMPILTNPIDIEVGKQGLYTLYQNRFINLQRHIYNPYGRPYTFADGDYRLFGQALCTRQSAAAPCLPLTQTHIDYFPDGNTVPIAIWKLAKVRNTEGDSDADANAYEDLNPSHMYDASMLALVSPGEFPGVYDAAVARDYMGTSDEREVLYVASNRFVPGQSSGAIYEINPLSESSRVWMESFELGADGYPVNYNGTIPVPTYTKMPMVVPEARIDIPLASAPSGFVPYKIYTANLTVDACKDLLVTSRGKNIVPIVDANGQTDPEGHVRFDNGTGQMFANGFTIIYRIEGTEGTRKVCKVPQSGGTVFVPLPAPNGVTAPSQVAALAFADFDSNEKMDIVAPNLQLEGIYEEPGKFSSYAYIYHSINGQYYPIFTPLDAVRLRVGYRKFDSAIGGFGGGNVSADGKGILVTNGLPLMLPSIGCQKSDNTSVSSIHGIMTSSLFGMTSKAIGLAPPFTKGIDDNYNYVPEDPYCVPEPETCGVAAGPKGSMAVPLWNDDCGMIDGCPWADTHPEQCTKKCFAYNALCVLGESSIHPGLIEAKPKPFVGFVDCNGLKVLCDIEKQGLPECDDHLGTDEMNVSGACCETYIADEENPESIPPGCADYFANEYVEVKEAVGIASSTCPEFEGKYGNAVDIADPYDIAGYFQTYKDKVIPFLEQHYTKSQIYEMNCADASNQIALQKLKFEQDLDYLTENNTKQCNYFYDNSNLYLGLFETLGRCCLHYYTYHLNDKIPLGCCAFYTTDEDKNEIEKAILKEKLPDDCCDQYLSNAYKKKIMDEGYTIPDYCCNKYNQFEEPDTCSDDQGRLDFIFEGEGGEADSGGDTEFAEWRPDVVYSSNDHAIARFDDMELVDDGTPPPVPASALIYSNSGKKSQPSTLADYILTGTFFMTIFRLEGQPTDDLVSQQMPPSCSFTDPDDQDVTGGQFDLSGSWQTDSGISADSDMSGTTLDLTGQIDPGQITDGGADLSDTGSGIFNIEHVNYKPVYDSIRFPRGRVMPGKREMTAVIPYKPVEGECGDGIPANSPNEECDYNDPDANALCVSKLGEGAWCTKPQCICAKPGEEAEPYCGDGIRAANEECDPEEKGTNAYCSEKLGVMGSWCDPRCICLEPDEIPPEPYCGDGIRADNEDCDPASPGTDAYCSEKLVKMGSWCDPQCTCIPPEPTSECRNNNLDDGEQCDIVNDEIEHQPGIEKCDICSVGCRCDTLPEELCGNNILDPGEQCDKVNDVWQHQPEFENKCTVCVQGCVCEFPPPIVFEAEEGEPEMIEAEMPSAAPVAVIPTCVVTCGASNNEYAELYERVTEEVASGKPNIRFCEHGQQFDIYCYNRNGAIKSTTTGQYMTLPSMVVEKSGSAFLPREGVIPRIEIIRQPVRLFPLNSSDPSAAKAQFILPSLANSNDIQLQGGVMPFNADIVVHGTDGTTIVNNVVKRNVNVIMPGQELPQLAFAAPMASESDQTADTLDHVTGILAYDWSRAIATQTYEDIVKPNLQENGLAVEDTYRENRQMNREDARVAIENGEISLPWDANLNYQFTFVQDVVADPSKAGAIAAQLKADQISGTFGGYGGASAEEDAATQTRNVYILASDADVWGGGTIASAVPSCGNCRMTESRIDPRAVLPLILFVLLSSGGVALVRVRVRARRRKDR